MRNRRASRCSCCGARRGRVRTPACTCSRVVVSTTPTSAATWRAVLRRARRPLRIARLGLDRRVGSPTGRRRVRECFEEAGVLLARPPCRRSADDRTPTTDAASTTASCRSSSCAPATSWSATCRAPLRRPLGDAGRRARGASTPASSSPRCPPARSSLHDDTETDRTASGYDRPTRVGDARRRSELGMMPPTIAEPRAALAELRTVAARLEVAMAVRSAPPPIQPRLPPRRRRPGDRRCRSRATTTSTKPLGGHAAVRDQRPDVGRSGPRHRVRRTPRSTVSNRRAEQPAMSTSSTRMHRCDLGRRSDRRSCGTPSAACADAVERDRFAGVAGRRTPPARAAPGRAAARRSRRPAPGRRRSRTARTTRRGRT